MTCTVARLPGNQLTVLPYLRAVCCHPSPLPIQQKERACRACAVFPQEASDKRAREPRIVDCVGRGCAAWADAN